VRIRSGDLANHRVNFLLIKLGTVDPNLFAPVTASDFIDHA